MRRADRGGFALAEYSASAKPPGEEFYADSFTSDADKHGKQA